MRTREEMIEEANELLLKLEVFDCDRLPCSECPFDTNAGRGPPFPASDCYSNQAREQRDWIRSSCQRAIHDE